MKKYIIVASVLALLSVILGAFGAHALADKLNVDQIASYKTGVHYHQIHSLAILLTAILIHIKASKWFRWAALGFVIGIIFFSGSIYLLSTRELIGLSNYKFLGPITPIGGLVFITSWLFLIIGASKIKTIE